MNTITLQVEENLSFQVKEAYKRLRTNIRFSGEEIKSIIVTSTMPDEGKSTVAFQLARALAEDGSNVILLDADIRKSVLVARMSSDKSVKGLSHFLSGQETLDNVFCKTNISNLFMIFAGAEVPNPTELLGNKKFQQMMVAMRKTYDYIIIDSPPLGSAIDAAVIARECDGAVMVIEQGRISYKLAQQVKKQIENSGCRLLGAVLNGADMRRNSFYGRYYGNYYGRA